MRNRDVVEKRYEREREREREGEKVEGNEWLRI